MFPPVEVKFTKQVNPFLYVIRDSLRLVVVDSRWIDFVLVHRRRPNMTCGTKSKTFSHGMYGVYNDVQCSRILLMNSASESSNELK